MDKVKETKLIENSKFKGNKVFGVERKPIIKTDDFHIDNLAV